MNEALEKLYNDFIEEYDPYYQEEENYSLEEMLYNLEEIYNEYDPAEADEDMIYLFEHLKAIIGQFKAAGIGRFDA